MQWACVCRDAVELWMALSISKFRFTVFVDARVLAVLVNRGVDAEITGSLDPVRSLTGLIQLSVSTNAQTGMDTLTHTHIHAYTHTHLYTHKHTHTLMVKVMPGVCVGCCVCVWARSCLGWRGVFRDNVDVVWRCVSDDYLGGLSVCAGLSIHRYARTSGRLA